MTEPNLLEQARIAGRDAAREVVNEELRELMDHRATAQTTLGTIADTLKRLEDSAKEQRQEQRESTTAIADKLETFLESRQAVLLEFEQFKHTVRDHSKQLGELSILQVNYEAIQGQMKEAATALLAIETTRKQEAAEARSGRKTQAERGWQFVGIIFQGTITLAVAWLIWRIGWAAPPEVKELPAPPFHHTLAPRPPGSGNRAREIEQ